MNPIDEPSGKYLFDRVEEILLNNDLTPKERIPKYRTLLEDLFKLLTSDSPQYLNGVFAKMVYLFKSSDIPGNIKNHSHSLRIFANDVVHKGDLLPGLLDDKRCVYELAEVVSYFFHLSIPDSICNYYLDSLQEISQHYQYKHEKRPSYDFEGVIENIYFPSEDSGLDFCVLTCQTDSLGRINLKILNHKDENGFGCDFSVFGRIAESFQNIYVTEVEQSKSNEEEYYTTKRSFIVLEPDYLIDAKELSGCRQLNYQMPGKYEDVPLLYMLSRFLKSEVTSPMMVGNVVGKMLDDLITKTTSYDYKSSFESVMRDNSFGMLCIANDRKRYNRQNIQQIFNESQLHEKQLKTELSRYEKKNPIVEPTFISNRYGLQGRLDILVNYIDSNRKDIIELKSSKKYPNLQLSLYPNHEAQTFCYDLLISSVYDNRVGTSSILYSSAPIVDKPLRNVIEENVISKQDLLMLRNNIVANELRIGKGLFASFHDIISVPLNCPSYLEEQLAEFRDTIEGLNGVLKDYFFGFIKFIYKELRVAKIGSDEIDSKTHGYAALWKASKEEKQENLDVLISLKVKNVSEDFSITLELEPDIFSKGVNVSSFRVGDSAILYPTPNRDEIHPLKSQILKCYVTFIHRNSVVVSLVNKQLDKSYFKESLYWALDRDFRETGYKHLLQSVYEFIKSDERVIELVLGNMQPQFEEEIGILENDLDEFQSENVKNAVRAKDYYLIQGPPGTGKTSKVLVEIVRNLQHANSNILIVAFTNRAVDEICEKLTRLDISCIRLGKGEKSYCWSAMAKNFKLDEMYERIQGTSVFVSTLSTFAGNLDILKFKPFDTLIVDEASQVLEPQIVGFLKYFRKWILIGDENQLPAVVMQSAEDSKCESELLNDLSLVNYRESLFYRLKKNAIKKGWDNCHGSLLNQYRMHRDIARFPSEMFYNGNLKIGTAFQEKPLADLSGGKMQDISKILTQSRIIFIPSKKCQRTKTNDDEADLVAKMVEYIADVYGDSFNPEKTIGVITPFRAQIANIRNKLNSKYHDVTIDTVERFQGSERDIIIVSYAVKSSVQLRTVKSINDEGVDRKLNVTLTRAKEHLIIMGVEEVMNKDILFRQLIDFIKLNDGYLLNPLSKEQITTSDLF